MNKNGLIISFFLFIISLSGYSQNDWKQGYIIENSGDTLYGLVDFRPPKSNSKYCYFKESEQDESDNYSPKQIKGYRYINGKFYISKVIKINEIERIAFLEFLIKGKANVYCLTDDKVKYFVEIDTQIHELKNSERRIYREGTKYLREQKEYIGTMSHLFQEANITKDIYNTELNHSSLINTAKKYHNKVSKDEEFVIYETEIKPIKIDFGIVYGKYNKTLHLNQNLSYNLDNNFSNFFGIALNFQNIPRIYERFSLWMELLASEYYLDNKQRYQFNIPLLLNYKLFSEKIYPKVELGTSMYFIQNEHIKTQHMTLIAGFSIDYNFFRDYRVFISTRIESNPRYVRIGGGLMF